MCRYVERIIALGLLMIVAVISIGCTVGSSKEEEIKQLVITNSRIDTEQSSSHIEINSYIELDEFKDAIREIDASNMQFAPDGYSDTVYDKNCVLMMITPTQATFTLDAEHMITVAKNLDCFYIQYDSSDSAIESMKEINKIDKGVLYVSQDKEILYGYIDID